MTLWDLNIMPVSLNRKCAVRNVEVIGAWLSACATACFGGHFALTYYYCSCLPKVPVELAKGLVALYALALQSKNHAVTKLRLLVALLATIMQKFSLSAVEPKWKKCGRKKKCNIAGLKIRTVERSKRFDQ